MSTYLADMEIHFHCLPEVLLNKMQMKRTILLFVALGVSNAYCAHVPKVYKKYFVNCCNAGKTNIRQRLDIDGYFTYQYLIGSTVCRGNVLFFDNGLCVDNWGLTDSTGKTLMEVVKEGAKSYFYQDAAWGTYELRGDTIITRTIVRASLLRPQASFAENFYKVKNRTTLIDISPVSDIKYQSLNLNFVPYQILPNPDYSWIKKQKCKPCSRP